MTTTLPFPTVRAEEVMPTAFTNSEAIMEANKCLYCADAPCMQACPTHIDIPGFIRKISTGNLTGAAKRILQANFLGGTCARVCPVEELCEGACVLNAVDKPIQIGRLQRHATDHLMESEEQPFAPGERTGKRVLVVGSGPAGLSAGANLRLAGHEVEIWEKKSIAGGLSTYGIISLREPLEIAAHEVKMVEDLGVTVHTEKELDDSTALKAAAEEFDAVFVATGLGKVPALNIPGSEKIIDGLDFIAQFKTSPEMMEVPRSVVVIGAGNTAIDAATTARQLGAQATVVYRRTSAEMTAFDHEYVFAVRIGIEFQFLASPAEVLADVEGNVTGLRCIRMMLGELDADGRRSPVPSGEADIVIPCDAVVSAIGQEKYDDDTDFGIGTQRGYLATRSTLAVQAAELPNVFVGGDAIRVEGDASTVMAVQDGKIAAQSIDNYLKEL